MNALINGINLAFDDFGNGPAVVLIHDLPLCRKMWQPQIDVMIKGGYRVIVPDLRGFGESEAGHKPFSIQNCSDDIISLLHYLGLGRAVMVGMGMASHLISDVQDRYSRRIAAAVLLSPTTSSVGKEDMVCRYDLAELVREGHRLTAIDNLCQQLLPEQQSLLTQQLGWDIQQWMEAAEPSTLSEVLTFSPKTSPQYAINAPTLALTGSRSMDVASLNELIPGAIIDKVPGAGHLINLEKPEIVNNHVLGFLNWLCRLRPRHHRLALAA